MYDSTNPTTVDWKNSTSANIKDKKAVSMFANWISGDYDPSCDEIKEIDGSTKGAWEAASKLKDVAYLGVFGHGNATTIWFNKDSTLSTSNVVYVDGQMPVHTRAASTYVAASELPTINFLESGFVELYACHTAAGEGTMGHATTIREALKTKFGVDVYGAQTGVSNSKITYFISLGGLIGNRTPEIDDPDATDIGVKTPPRDKVPH